MNDTRTILRALGYQRCADALGIGHRAVSMAATGGKFPSHWYPTLKRLGCESGIDIPDNLFTWRIPSDVSALRASQ